MQRGVYMSDIIYKTVITFLVIFAIIKMLTRLYDIVFSKDTGIKEIYIFIHVKNQQENIEYIVRCTIFNYLHNYGGRRIPYIVIVDKGSEDETANIAKRLCRDYEFVFYATEEEYRKFKNDVRSI